MITIILAQVFFWCIRFKYSYLEAKHDFLWISTIILWFYRKGVCSGILNAPKSTWILGFALFLCIVCYYLKIPYQHDQKTPSDQENEALEKQKLSDPKDLRPLVFPCRTSHTRMFPKKHSFSYSYLFVGIPVDWQNPVEPRATWFHIDAADYLNRGYHPLGLKGKLVDFLRTQVKTRLKPGTMKLNTSLE